MKKAVLLACSACVAVAGQIYAGTAAAEERAVIIKGFGAESGVVRSLGINSEAAMRAAVDKINSEGGIRLGDGATGKIQMEFWTIAAPRRMASPSCVVWRQGPRWSASVQAVRMSPSRSTAYCKR